MSAAQQKIERYKKYLEIDPENSFLWISYGDALHESGQFDNAAEAYQKSLELQPDYAVAESRLASIAIGRHQFSEAERLLIKLRRAQPDDPAIAYNLGLALFYQKKFGEALTIFDFLVDIPMDTTETHYYVVSCLHNLGRLEEAIARAEHFLARNPSVKLRGYLALVLLDAQRPEEALHNARSVLQENSGNADAATVLGTDSIERQDMATAADYFSLVTQREPDNIRGWQGLSLIALYRADHALALAHINEALKHSPDNVGNYNLLGWIHLVAQRFAESERAFERGINVERNNAEAHGGLAVALAMQHKVDAAKREIDLGLGLDRYCFGALYARSILLALSGNQKLAMRMVADMLQAPLRQDGRTLIDSLTDYWKKQR